MVIERPSLAVVQLWRPGQPVHVLPELTVGLGPIGRVPAGAGDGAGILIDVDVEVVEGEPAIDGRA
jgi:hypothetical protein